jgi:DNA-binding PadR family transcriptional regulator
MSSSLKLRDLVVLGLLRERPRYGYEIKTIIDHLMSHIIDVSSGSLYYGLKKLLQEGLIDEASVEKVGRRPERSVYCITAQGEAMLSSEMPRVIFPQAHPYFQLDLALFFFDLMDPHDRAKRLAMRREYLSKAMVYLDEVEERYSSVSPKGPLYILMHVRHFFLMELEFIGKLLADLPEGAGLTLTSRELSEVHAEIESFKQHVRPEMALPQSFSESAEALAEG